MGALRVRRNQAPPIAAHCRPGLIEGVRVSAVKTTSTPSLPSTILGSTRYYLDPHSGTLLQRADATACWYRWLFNGFQQALDSSRPASTKPTLSHFATRRRMRLSAIRCLRKRRVHEWDIASKEDTTHYPSPRCSGSGDHCPQASCVRGADALRDQQHQAARRLARARHSSERQPVAHSGCVDRLARGACRRFAWRCGQRRRITPR